MGRDDYVLRFEAGAKDGGLISRLPNGKAVFVHRESPRRPQAGEEWLCRVDERGSVAFALLMERAPATPTPSPRWPAGLNWNEVREAEERLRAQFDAAIDKALGPLSRQVAELATQVRDLTQRPASPAARDAGPKDLRVLILGQLHTRGNWGGHVQRAEHFRHGRFARFDADEVRRGLDGLVAERLLLQEGRASDARYSLNPARKKEISDLVGLAPAPTVPVRPQEGGATPAADWVERGAFENTVRGLRESVDGLRREVAAQQAPGQPAGSAVLERRVDELEGRARGVDASLTKLSARQDSLEARPKEPARSKRGSTRPESLAALREILGEDDEAEPAPRPEQAATLAASLLPGEGLAKAQAFAANLWLAGLVMGPPAPFYEVGRFGACLVPTCEAAPKGFVPVFDLTRPRGPGVLPGLACPAHADPPPWAVYLRRGMNRRDADLAVEAFVTLGESLGLPEPPSLSSQRVHVFGSAAARREWDLAVKRRGTR